MNDHLTGAVARYLRDCADHSSALEPRYHPTEKGAIKVIFARNSAEKDAIKEEFRRIWAGK